MTRPAEQEFELVSQLGRKTFQAAFEKNTSDASSQSTRSSKTESPDSETTENKKSLSSTRKRATSLSPSCPIARKFSWISTSSSRKKHDRSRSWSFDSFSNGFSSSSTSTVTSALNKQDVPKRKCSFHNLFYSTTTTNNPSSTEEEQPQQEDEEEQYEGIFELERLLMESEAFRMDVVSNLLSRHISQGHLKVRFILAVIDFESTAPSKTKVMKGTKIISLFARKSSNFRIDSLPKSMRISQLVSFKQQILLELYNEDFVRDLITEESSSDSDVEIVLN